MGDGASSGGGSFALSRRGVLLFCLGVLLVAGVMLHRVYEAWPMDEGSFFGLPMFRWKAALATGARRVSRTAEKGRSMATIGFITQPVSSSCNIAILFLVPG